MGKGVRRLKEVREGDGSKEGKRIGGKERVR